LKQLRLHLLVVALVAGLLVPVTAFARVLSICNMSGRAGKVCCCHRSAEKTEHCRAPSVDRAPCCTQLVSHTEKASATQGGAASDVPPAALLERLPAISHVQLALAQTERLAPRARAPPPQGPRIFLRDCAILS
jgi:hypothetical protein